MQAKILRQKFAHGFIPFIQNDRTVMQQDRSAWIKVNNDNSAYQILRKKPDGGDSVINFNKTSGNKLQVYISGGDGTWIQGESTNLITADNAWHNVAFSYQANAADSLKIYIDGVGETVVLTGTNPLSQIKTSNQPLHIGSFGGTSTYFDGLIDDVRIYNTALSASDIALLASPFGQIDRSPLPEYPRLRDALFPPSSWRP